MKIESIKINKLKPATYNPRQISTKQYNDLKKSLSKFSLVEPIVVNKDMTIIGGHQRYKICKELKHTEIDCVVLDLNKEEERELNIRLNKNTGDFDMDILANEFDIDELTDWGFKHIDLDLNIDKIQKDLSDKIELQYKIEVEVISEKEQEILYKDLTKKGYICRILTL
jgi:ParB-like chromosome segregation protein Spo0J